LGYPGVLCCVGAVNRILPNYIIHMWMATTDGGLAATLYGPCNVNALVGPRIPVKLACRSSYPFQDTISVQVTPARRASFPLSFRVPSWCRAPRLAVNGVSVKSMPDEHGFVRIERAWAPGDVVTLKFPMSVHLLRGFETEYPMANRKYFGFKPDSVFAPRRLPYESITFGPLLFALPIPDLDPNTPMPGARWQFALDNRPKKEGRDITVERKPMPPHWDWPLAAPIVLKVPAKDFAWVPTEAQALPDSPVPGHKAETIALVPYGCTKFRVSMFPVTSRAWNSPPLPK